MPGGLPTEGLIAQVIVAKFGDLAAGWALLVSRIRALVDIPGFASFIRVAWIATSDTLFGNAYPP